MVARRARTGPAVLLAAALVGCSAPGADRGPTDPVPTGPSAPAPGPTTVAPAFRRTPEAGGEATPCDDRQYTSMQERDAVYSEAEAVVRKLGEVEAALYRAGAPVGAEVARYAMGDHLHAVAMAHRAQAAAGTRSSADPTVVWLRRNPGATRGNSVVSLVACVDATAVHQLRGDQVVATGGFTRETLFLSRQVDGLKVSASDVEVVGGC